MKTQQKKKTKPAAPDVSRIGTPSTVSIPSNNTGPHKPVAVPANAVWLTTSQLLNRFSGMSQMWLWRKLNGEKKDPHFPQPRTFGSKRGSGQRKFFLISEVEEYERSFLSSGGEE
jgi:hypothetical protein